MKPNVLLTLLSLCCLPAVTSYTILMLVSNVRSHMIYYSRLGQTLVSRGHDVTLVRGEGVAIPDVLEYYGIDYRTYHVNGSLLAEEEWFKLEILGLAFEGSVLKVMEGLGKLVERIEGEHGQLLEDKQLMGYLRDRKFDFIITDQMDAYYVAAYVMDAPFAPMAIECLWYEFRLPYIPSYVPTLFGELSDRMTFSERLLNTVFYLLMTPAVFRSGGHDKVARYAPWRKNMGVAEVNSQASLCLRLRESVTDTPRGFTPNIINIGSHLVRPPGELPGPLVEFVEGATDGLILLTFGSWLDVWPEELTDIFLEVFSNIPQRVLWKYKGTLRHQPSPNVKVMDWVPQNEVLAHPNTQAFLTHCGIGGFHEAVYHGVPILGFPMAIDQKSNAAIIATRGYGLILDIASLTAHALWEAISTVVEEPSYRKNMAAASAILKDRPPGGETAAYWIEHVIKHGGGHLRSEAFSMPWYQFMCLDIIAFVLVIVVVFIMVVVLVLKCCWRLCCRRCRKGGKQKTE